MRDAGGISGVDNNFHVKNTYEKVGFIIYNIVDANVDASADIEDTSSIQDTGSIDGTDNNIDNKNAYTRADFSTYNNTSANVDADAGDAIVTDEKVSSNTNNTGVSQSGRLG